MWYKDIIPLLADGKKVRRTTWQNPDWEHLIQRGDVIYLVAAGQEVEWLSVVVPMSDYVSSNWEVVS
jgi:hypothetical protein